MKRNAGLRQHAVKAKVVLRATWLMGALLVVLPALARAESKDDAPAQAAAAPDSASTPLAGASTNAKASPYAEANRRRAQEAAAAASQPHAVPIAARRPTGKAAGHAQHK
jgi:hypothetical protein